MIKKIVLLIPLIIFLCFALDTSNGEIIILLGSGLYMLYPLFLKRYSINPNHPILIVTFFNIALLIIGTIIKGISKTHFSGNFFVIYLILSYYLGIMLFYKKNITTKLKYILLLIFLATSYLLSQTIPIILENELFFRSYTGETSNEKINLNNFKIFNAKENKEITLSELNSDIIIIDFWNNNCGVCIEKFEFINELIKEKEINTDKVKIISLNIYREKKDINEGHELFKEQNLLFENYFVGRNYEKSFGIKGYPTTIVIKNNTVIFKGTIETLNLFKYKYL